MKITIEVEHKSELEKLKTLFRSLKINTVSVVHENESQSALSITKGNSVLIRIACLVCGLMNRGHWNKSGKVLGSEKALCNDDALRY